MNELSNVSYQAFLEEVQNWEFTLTRQAKKLKLIKKSVNNKLQINTIDITLLAIEAQFIQYRKIKDKKFSDNASIVELYNSLSKKFIGLIQKIGEACDQQKYQNTSHNISKNEETVGDLKPKHFLQETFTYSMSKQPIKKKTYSVIDTKRLSGELAREKSKSRYRKATKSILEERKFKNVKNLTKLQVQDDQDLSDIRYQLKEIKSMIVQMDKQIKLHNHEEIDRQLSKISHHNKKIAIEIKGIREDNQFLLTRMQNIKQQINREKEIQNNMIRQFEAGKSNNPAVNELSKDSSPTQEVSEWVKVRI